MFRPVAMAGCPSGWAARLIASGFAEERLGLDQLALDHGEPREVVQAGSDVRVPGGRGCSTDLERFAEERLGLNQFVLGLKQTSEAVQA